MNKFTKFVEKEIKKLEKAGFIVKRVRITNSWITFHIIDDKNNIHTSVDVVNRPKSSPNKIGINMRSLYNKNRSYWYNSDKKFQRGFERNIINKHISMIKTIQKRRKQND